MAITVPLRAELSPGIRFVWEERKSDSLNYQTPFTITYTVTTASVFTGIMRKKRDST